VPSSFFLFSDAKRYLERTALPSSEELLDSISEVMTSCPGTIGWFSFLNLINWVLLKFPSPGFAARAVLPCSRLHQPCRRGQIF
jgi:hypothetical protein